MVLCEHHPVFTFGLREVDFHAKAADMKEKLVGCDVYKVNLRLTMRPHSINSSTTVKKRWPDYFPWPRTAGLLSNPKLEKVKGIVIFLLTGHH